MKPLSRKHWFWIAPLSMILLVGLTLYLWPETPPENEGQKIFNQAIPYDVVIIFNPGGWGDATLAQAQDFAPVLDGMQQALTNLGYSSTVIAYTRTPPGFSGRISDVKELANSFKYSSEAQARDIENLLVKLPQKQFVVVGFSNGGGLTGRTFQRITDRRHVCAIVAGVPFTFKTYSSENSLVLNNNGQDTLASGDLKSIFLAFFEAPFRWVWAKITGKPLSLSLAFEYPGHAYPWSSPEVGPPIIKFLKDNLKK